MPRVKRGTKRRARRKKYLKRTKGFFLTKSKLYQSAQEAANRADRYGIVTGINLAEIYGASQLLSELIGFEVQPNKAIVGRNAFAHEAGIHQHGVLSNPLCYEIMTPETVGIPAERIVLGKHSGRHALVYKYRELGHELSADEVNQIYSQFTMLADRKKNIYEQDLIAMLYAHRGGMRDHQAPQEMRPV